MYIKERVRDTRTDSAHTTSNDREAELETAELKRLILRPRTPRLRRWTSSQRRVWNVQEDTAKKKLRDKVAHYGGHPPSQCRGVVPPLTVVFVRPIVYISPPVGFDQAGIDAESNMIGCSDGLYTAQVRVTIAAEYCQQVYLYVRLPTSESEQPKATVGSPFDLDVEPAEVKWEKTGIFCGRVKGHAWPDACSDGVGFDLAIAGVHVELMVQQCDEYSNPVTKCDSKSPPPELIQAVFKGEHKRKILSRATCDAACPHNP